MVPGKYQLSSDKDIQWEESTRSNTWVAHFWSGPSIKTLKCHFLKKVFFFMGSLLRLLNHCHGGILPVIYNTGRVSAQQHLLSFPALPDNCSIKRALRVDCGHQSITSLACLKLGCCYDAHDSTCYYRLNCKIAICLIYEGKLFISDISSK